MKGILSNALVLGIDIIFALISFLVLVFLFLIVLLSRLFFELNLKAFINQMQRMGNWGYPAGMGLDWSFLQDAAIGIPGLVKRDMSGGTRRTITPSVLGG